MIYATPEPVQAFQERVGQNMESIWSKTVKLPAFDHLPGDRSADVAIIGGGMAGILIAKMLKQRGLDVVVLEARTVASGQTCNTTAKITSQHGLKYDSLIQNFGEKLAWQYAQANETAILEYHRMVEEEQIDCGFQECPAYLYSLLESEPLQREAEAAKRLGIQAVYTEQTALPFAVKGAVRFDHQAQFHPLAFLSGIIHDLTIYEHTRVTSVEADRAITDRGTVKADKIVFATHYPFLNQPGYYFLRMHQERSYVLALKDAVELDGMYIGIDEKEGWSLRNENGLLLFGGGGHRTGENRAGGQYRALRNKAKELWPQAVEVAHWSAQDCMPLDGVPYIGCFSDPTPNWYVATGFQKWGMTSSMTAAMIIADLIMGVENPYAAVFSPQRFTPSASAQSFLEEGKHAVRDLSRRVFAPPRGLAEELPAGHGGVVELDGEKVGVYKDEDGEIFAVSIRCPHLGCQLEWNPDEKSWDCPCHGSRFDYRGNLLDNPAQEGLHHE